MSTCFCRSSFTHLYHSPVRISFRSRIHGPLSPSPVPSSSVAPQSLNLRRSSALLSFMGPRTCLAHQSGSQFLCRSPVTERTSFAGPPFVQGSTDLPRSPVRTSLRWRVHATVSFTVPRFVSPSSVLRSSVIPRPHLLSLTGPWTCLVHRFPLPPSFIGSHFPCYSSLHSTCTMCVYGGAVCTDLVNQLQYNAISDIISLLLPPTWVALLYVRSAWLDCYTVPRDLVSW
jgi:hypothetical protein